MTYLGEESLLLEDGEQSHGLLHELDGGLEVHAEVDHLPLDALAHVLLLLQHEHVVVEELLQLLVAEVDADLLEGVELEDLEAGDVQHADEVDL